MKETIEIQRKWLKTLSELSEECANAYDDWNDSEKPFMPMCISKLIGFSSSAKTLLKLNK